MSQPIYGADILPPRMFLSSPIWLIGLAPWAAVVVWVLWGRRRRVDVPFVRLWRGPVEGPRPKRSVQAPPRAIALALLAALLAVLGASGPMLPGVRSREGPALTLILDRGLSMSAHGTRDLRYRETAEAARAELARRFADVPVEVLSVPGESVRATDLGGLIALANALSPTAIDTHQRVRGTVAERLATTSTPVIVISDATLSIKNEWMIQIVPQTAVRDTGITVLAARPRPRPQVMVRVRNDSPKKTCVVVVTSASAPVEKQLDLPEPGGERDYFIDLPRLGEVISAELKVDDDVSADKRAWLVSEGSSSKIEPRCPLPPALRRMIDVYQRARPPAEDSAQLAVVQDVSQAPAAAPAVIVAQPTTSLMASPERTVMHPITEHLRWGDLSGPVHVAGDPPAGWMPVVSAGGRALVAVTGQPPNQVWVGFDAPDWEATPDFVIFWTDAFDWAGGGPPSFVNHALDRWTTEWKLSGPPDAEGGLWPGLYRRSDGAMRAFNAPDVPIPPPARSDWRARLAAIATLPAGMGLNVPLLIAAVTCLLVAATTWKRPELGR